MTWQVRPANEAEVDKIASELKLPRAIARVLWLRDCKTPEAARSFLANRQSLDAFKEPISTPGMQRAVARIREAIEKNEAIVIFGDYDCDGVTSSALLYRYLARGLKGNVRAYLPDRFKDGYGITPQAVERLAAEGTRLIITCDNGISAHAAIATAAALGVDLIVTDHHQVPEELPTPYAIVHPQVEFKEFKDLAGVGVAFMLILALEGGFTTRMEHFLDILAIGTVADMVPLNGPNRALVWAGLERLRAGKAVQGVKALAEIAKVNLRDMNASHIGFRFGPRLNAAGRLETPDVGFRLLSTNDPAEARDLAQQLDAINATRRELNAELESQILERIEREVDLNAEPFVVLADEHYHHGIIGIVAGRVKERFRVPVLLFSSHGEGIWKASGRSPEGVHLYEALHACRDHLLGFGGHAQAAGCSALEAEIAPLRKALNQHIRDIGWTRPADLVWLDAELPFRDATFEFLDRLDALEPFGQRNPAPVFGLYQVRIISIRQKGKRVGIQIDDGQDVREVVLWRDTPDTPHPIEAHVNGWVNLVYQPEINEWNGSRTVQFSVKRIDPAEAPAPVEVAVANKTLATVDDRRGQSSWQLLEALPQDEKVSVYAYRPLDSRLIEAMGHCRAELIGPLCDRSVAGGTVLCVDPPLDEAVWTSLQARADKLILAWNEEEEPPLEPEWLTNFYQALALEHGGELRSILKRITPKTPINALTALAILREVGLLAERGKEWSLLAALPDGIDLRHLASYQAALEAQAFRRHLGALSPLST